MSAFLYTLWIAYWPIILPFGFVMILGFFVALAIKVQKENNEFR